MADSAGCHLPGGSKVHLFHEYCAIRKMSVSAIGGDGSRRRIDDMKLLRTLALVGSYRPAPQELIRGSIGVGHMQVSVRVGCGLGFELAVSRDEGPLPARDDADHCRYSCRTHSYPDRLHRLLPQLFC